MEKQKLLRARNLIKFYGSDKVLDIDQIELAEGSVVSLLGPNGCGKTTLIKVLSWLIEAQNREIFFRGQRIKEDNSLNYRRQLGFIWQKPLFYNQSVRDNVALGLKFRGLPGSEVEEKVEAVINRLGIGELKDKAAHRLSGGQQQKVSIARTLVTEPEILFIDEPNTSLDMESINLVEEIIKKEADRGTGIMLVTHNFYRARELSDKVIFLKQGKKVAENSPDKFFAQKKKLLHYL